LRQTGVPAVGCTEVKDDEEEAEAEAEVEVEEEEEEEEADGTEEESSVLPCVNLHSAPLVHLPFKKL